MLPLINPVLRPQPFDHPDWPFEAKFDGFRAAADTIRGLLISRNGNRMKPLLDLLAAGLVFDGELVVLDDNGRPLFNVVGVVVGCPSALTPAVEKDIRHRPPQWGRFSAL